MESSQSGKTISWASRDSDEEKDHANRHRRRHRCRRRRRRRRRHRSTHTEPGCLALRAARSARDRAKEREHRRKKNGEQSSRIGTYDVRQHVTFVRTFFHGPYSAITAGRRAIARTRARIREIAECGERSATPSFAVDVRNVSRRSDL